MNEINEIFKQFRQGNGEWYQFINSIKITNIHGWNGQTTLDDSAVRCTGDIAMRCGEGAVQHKISTDLYT